MSDYVIGLDYGTDSVRAVLVDAISGQEVTSHVHWYKRWNEGRYSNPSSNQYRQHILDHVEGLEVTISKVVATSHITPEDVKGICVDTTGSSPVPVDESCTPLCLREEFQDNPNAMMVLWKDHTATAEANEINELCRSWGGEDFTKYVGGIYSSEWFWAKILHIIREDEAIKKNAYSWMEHCDVITNILIGNHDIKNAMYSRCAAGHKAMWHEDWDGLPPAEFLEKLHPDLGRLRERLYSDTHTSDQRAGHLSKKWADKLGLSTDTVVAVGTFDAHAGAVGAGIEEHCLVRVMGTSTCDIMVASHEIVGPNCVKGICGQVSGSVIPGMVGLEAGQSAFGDVLAWYKNTLMWPARAMILKSEHLKEDDQQRLISEMDDGLMQHLSSEAEKIPLNKYTPVALDWINGRRTPDANQNLKSAIMGLSLGIQTPHLFQSLVLSICFGSKKIVDRFEEEGIMIKKIKGIGGVARKSPYIMQTLADVLGRPISVVSSDQAPALGAAIYAAVAAGIYRNVEEASQVMSSSVEAEYFPDQNQSSILKELMEKYDSLGEFVEESIKSD